MGVRLLDQRGIGFFGRTMTAGSQQCIHNHIDLLWPGRIGRMNFTARIQPRVSCTLRLFRQRFFTFARQQRNGFARRLSQSRQHITIATVVAVTTQNQPVAGLWPVRSQMFVSGLSGTQHQLIQRNAERIGPLLLKPGHSLRRPDRIW